MQVIPEQEPRLSETGGPAVLAEGLVKHYDGGKDEKVEAVRGVDLEIRTGEIFGFLGPNGAGKSTTVRMLTTLPTITAGRAEVAGACGAAGGPTAPISSPRRASATACERVEAPSLVIALRTWVRTVSGESTS